MSRACIARRFRTSTPAVAVSLSRSLPLRLLRLPAAALNLPLSPSPPLSPPVRSLPNTLTPLPSPQFGATPSPTPTHDTGRIQIDDPVLGCFCDEGFRRRMREAGVDPARLLDTYLGVLDACVRGRPAGMAAGVHICRGNVKVCAFSPPSPSPFPFMCTLRAWAGHTS